MLAHAHQRAVAWGGTGLGVVRVLLGAVVVFDAPGPRQGARIDHAARCLLQGPGATQR